MGLLIAALVIDVLVGMWIGHGKGRLADGLLLGLLLGPVGWLIMACLRPSFDEDVRRERRRQDVLAEVGKDREKAQS